MMSFPATNDASPQLGGEKEESRLFGRYAGVLAELAAKGKGEGRIISVTLLSQQMPFGGRDTAGGTSAFSSDEMRRDALSKTQAAFLVEEDGWASFGKRSGVRVVIMRVADRVVAPYDSALKLAYSTEGSKDIEGATTTTTTTTTTKAMNPCRVEQASCSEHDSLTRIHAEDLWAVLLRMLSMFDIVETHGADASMKGTASLSSSTERFPSGTVLDVVDDGPPDSMAMAEHWASVMMGKAPLCSPCPESPAAQAGGELSFAHRTAAGRNAELKEALGMRDLIYPSYRHGAAKLFGVGEF